jgi:hypothetical protein
MKPHIYLAYSWYDCGHRYESWNCSSGCPNVGKGSSPRSAYLDWLGKKGEV